MWASAGGARRLGEPVCVMGLTRRVVVVLGSAFFAVVLPRGGVQGTMRLRFLLETVHDAVVVEERVGVNEWLRGADGATAVEIRSAAVAVHRLLRREAHEPHLAPLATLPDMHGDNPGA